MTETDEVEALRRHYDAQLDDARAQRDAADTAWKAATEASAARAIAVLTADSEYQRLLSAATAAHQLARNWCEVVEAKAAVLHEQYWQARRQLVSRPRGRRPR
jgi:hypothetical protein